MEDNNYDKSSVKVLCKICNNKVPIDLVRYDKTGTKLICKSCYEKTVPKEKAVIAETVKEEDNYVCDKCGYKFKRKGNIQVYRCHYCGKGILRKENVMKNTVDEYLEL